MFNVKTDYPVAINSDDHKYPEGIYYDNNCNFKFVQDVEQYFNSKPINFMDLGCAGGELVCQIHKRGHNSVGLEGSDHCLNIRPDMIKEVGREPAGMQNWQIYGNKNLFTCDVTKPYEVIQDNNLFQCDLITCWDVMEHFEPDEVDMFLMQTHKHLKDKGIFIASIALFDSGRHAESQNTPAGLNYHKSVFNSYWWLKRLQNYFKQIAYPFSVTNRDIDPLGGPGYLIYAGVKE